MSEEFKKKKILKLAGKFVFFTCSIFVGVTLAILLSASILRPKHPPMPVGPMPMGIERRLPPPPVPPHHMGPQRHHEQFEERVYHPRAHRAPDLRPDVKPQADLDKAPLPPQNPQPKDK